MRSLSSWRQLLAGLLRIQLWSWILFGSCDLFSGQVTLDGSLGPSGDIAGPNFDIEATSGKTVGNNLFHSFSKFDLSAGEVASFSGPDNIRNILSRVTGGSASSIDGTIQSTISGANFFLINPSGVMFGPNAQLDVSGSFVVTTADYIQLANGERFLANNPSPADDALLTSASPIAFGFLGPEVAPIMIRGGDIDLGEPPVVLQVAEEKVMSFVGGDIEVENASLTVPSGRINFISVASRGEVALDATDLQSSLDTDELENMGSIAITAGSFLDLSGSIRGGGLVIHAGEITIDLSGVGADNFGFEDSLQTEIIASESILLRSGFIAGLPFDVGAGGGIHLSAPSVSLTEGSNIGTDTGGPGAAGDILIEANDLVIDSAAISATASGPGGGGDIDLSVSTMTLANDSFLSTITFDGPAGNVHLVADQVELSGFGSIQSDSFGASPGGDVVIETGHLAIAGSASISASTFGPASAGNVRITAGDVTLDGAEAVGFETFTGITARARDFAEGVGGSIEIEADSVSVLNGAQITSSAEFSTVGDGGTIRIHADRIELQNGGSIQSASMGLGNAGGISLVAGTRLELESTSSISVSSDQSNGGDIQVFAGREIRLTDSQITAQAAQDGGNITLLVPADAEGNKLSGKSEVSLLRSQVTAESINGNGGNVVIDPQFVILDHSQILANAIIGNGGNIDIITDFLLSSASVIDASSQFGLQGSVEITAPDVDLSGSLLPLSASLLDAGSRLQERCAVRTTDGISSFIVVGLGGMPLEPEGLIPSLPLRLKRSEK